MSRVKLTPLQIETLGLIVKGEVRNVQRGYAAWRIEGANPSVVGRLISLGYARWPGGMFGEAPAELTEAGHSYLSSLKENRDDR